MELATYYFVSVERLFSIEVFLFLMSAPVSLSFTCHSRAPNCQRVQAAFILHSGITNRWGDG